MGVAKCGTTIALGGALASCSLMLGDGLTGGSGKVDGGPGDAARESAVTSDAVTEGAAPTDGPSEDGGTPDPASIPLNGGFETGSVACGTGWSNSGGAALSVSATARTGGRACLVCGSGGRIGVIRDWSDTSLGAGAYQATFWYRSQNGTGPGYFAVYAEASDASSSEQVNYVSRGEAAPAPSWTSIQIIFVVPQGKSLSRLAWYFDGEGCVLVDDVTLMKGT